MRLLGLAIVLCNCVTVLAFTARLGILVRLHDTSGQDLPQEWHVIGACALLAVNHVQHRVSDLVQEANQLSPGFNVTYVLEDTQSSASEAVQLAYTLTNDLPVHAIVGPAKSQESGPVSLISGMNGVPSVSYWATSPALSDKTTYPFFSRLIIVDTKYVDIVLETCLLMQWRKVAILYVDDLWGSGLAEAISTSSGRLALRVESAQKFKLQDDSSIDKAVRELAQTDVRVFLLVAFGEDLEAIMLAAERHGVVGRGYQWVSCNGIHDPSGIVASSSDPARLQRLAAGVVNVADLPLYGAKGDRFRAAFQAAALSSMSHPLLDFGGADPRAAAIPSLCGYAYDAVWAAALAIDRTALADPSAAAGGWLDGEAVNQALRDVKFEGATGRVELEAETGDRKLEGMTYVLEAWAPRITASGTPTLAAEVIAVHQNGTLTRVAQPYWPGGATTWEEATRDGVCASGQVLGAETLQCEACPAGTRQEGAACEPCPVGHHGPVPGLAVCVPCWQEGFANETGLSQCHRCPPNHEMGRNGSGGSVSESECVCRAGYILQCRFLVWQVLLVGMAILVVGIVGVSLVLYCKGSLALDEEERHVQGEVLRTRRRLLLRREDGFLLPWERKPWLAYAGLGRQSFHALNQKQLEAAARLSLLLEFDMDALDMLALYLQFLRRRTLHRRRPARPDPTSLSSATSDADPAPAPDGPESKQYQALCSLLLEMSKILLDPNADDDACALPVGGANPSQNVAAVAGSLAVGAAGAPITAEDRFAFFRYKVAKLRLWDSSGNFDKLKQIAQEYMDDLRAQCDELYAQMAREDGGRALLDFPNYPAPRPDGLSDEMVMRQDHAAVHAIRLDKHARKEVALQQQAAGGGALAPLSPHLTRVSSLPDLAEGASPVGGPQREPAGDAGLRRCASQGRGRRGNATRGASGERGDEEAGWGAEGGGEEKKRGGGGEVKEGGLYGWLREARGLSGGGRLVKRASSAKALRRGEEAEAGPQRPAVDEEVFIVQLNLRASLLDPSFQKKVRVVVGRRLLEEEGGEAAEGRGEEPAAEAEAEAEAEAGEKGEGGEEAAAGAAEAALGRCGDRVKVQGAPIKSKQRMQEKVLEYAAEAPLRASPLPLAANILDPVRASVVCLGPQDIVAHARWLMDNGTRVGLPVVRVKNKFAESVDSSQYDGYRDLMLCVLFTGERGLRIIGEIQLHDPRLYRLKLKMHKLYKVKRATSVNKI